MAGSLRLAKAERIRLRGHSEFNEAWLQQQIVDDPGMLGLGDSVEVIGREVRQPQGGRLDLLLKDQDEGTRYEVELMLGDTDPGHIIRCIEYWDVERKRYSDQEHVAVLVAENITSRFLNVIGLFNSAIPMIALQLNALRVGDSIVLHFTRVLDLITRGDDEEAAESVTVSREDWERRSSIEAMKLVDDCFAILGELSANAARPNYKKGYIGVLLGTVVDNVVTFTPKKLDTRVHAHRLADKQLWRERLEEGGFPVLRLSKNGIKFSVTPSAFAQHRSLITELLSKCYEGRWSNKAD